MSVLILSFLLSCCLSQKEYLCSDYTKLGYGKTHLSMENDSYGISDVYVTDMGTYLELTGNSKSVIVKFDSKGEVVSSLNTAKSSNYHTMVVGDDYVKVD